MFKLMQGFFVQFLIGYECEICIIYHYGIVFVKCVTLDDW